MSGSAELRAGTLFTWERVFSEDDVRSFGHLSGDQGDQHVRPQADGRVMVHGLLTATLPTKIGGDLNFIAQEIEFAFPRPVFTGDRVRCEVTIVSIDAVDRGMGLTATFTCRNQDGKEVLTGRTRGIITR